MAEETVYSERGLLVLRFDLDEAWVPIGSSQTPQPLQPQPGRRPAPLLCAASGWQAGGATRQPSKELLSWLQREREARRLAGCPEKR